MVEHDNESLPPDAPLGRNDSPSHNHQRQHALLNDCRDHRNLIALLILINQIEIDTSRARIVFIICVA